ncbi:MAG: hypothetical protein J5905_07030 [Prevotella sp.]|nr:hypothetical protein [Prevotella sp.]
MDKIFRRILVIGRTIGATLARARRDFNHGLCGFARIILDRILRKILSENLEKIGKKMNRRLSLISCSGKRSTKGASDYAYGSKISRKSKKKSKGKNLKLTNFTNRGLKKSPYTGRFRGSKKERG